MTATNTHNQSNNIYNFDMTVTLENDPKDSIIEIRHAGRNDIFSETELNHYSNYTHSYIVHNDSIYYQDYHKHIQPHKLCDINPTQYKNILLNALFSPSNGYGYLETIAGQQKYNLLNETYSADQPPLR